MVGRAPTWMKMTRTSSFKLDTVAFVAPRITWSRAVSSPDVDWPQSEEENQIPYVRFGLSKNSSKSEGNPRQKIA